MATSVATELVLIFVNFHWNRQFKLVWKWHHNTRLLTLLFVKKSCASEMILRMNDYHYKGEIFVRMNPIIWELSIAIHRNQSKSWKFTHNYSNHQMVRLNHLRFRGYHWFRGMVRFRLKWPLFPALRSRKRSVSPLDTIWK